MKQNNNITILGCGLSGMITALSLASDKSIKITIIESKDTQDDKFFKESRTTALTTNSQDFFLALDYWKELKEIAAPIMDIYVVDSKAPTMLHFLQQKPKESKEAMGYMVENTIFKKLLFNLIKTNPNITLIDKTNYSKIENNDFGTKITLENGVIFSSNLTIICDGPRSKAKNLFFSPDIIKSYNQKALTFVVQHQKPHEGTAVEHFMASGPFAILPLSSPNHSSIVWTVKSTKAELLAKLPKDELTYLVQENFGQFLGKVTIEEEPAIFNLTAYATSKYYNKSIILIADSAHIIHPLAGQGLNQGIKDIDTLTKIIKKSGCNNLDLSQYQQLRKQDNLNMLEATDMINKIFSNNSKLFHNVRQFGFKVINNFPAIKDQIVNYAMGKR